MTRDACGAFGKRVRLRLDEEFVLEVIERHLREQRFRTRRPHEYRATMSADPADRRVGMTAIAVDGGCRAEIGIGTAMLVVTTEAAQLALEREQSHVAPLPTIVPHEQTPVRVPRGKITVTSDAVGVLRAAPWLMACGAARRDADVPRKQRTGLVAATRIEQNSQTDQHQPSDAEPRVPNDHSPAK